MKIYLLDRKAVMDDCWNAYFSNEPDVTVVCDNLAHFLDTIEVDCVVSPANSYGLMDGACGIKLHH